MMNVIGAGSCVANGATKSTFASTCHCKDLNGESAHNFSSTRAQLSLRRVSQSGFFNQTCPATSVASSYNILSSQYEIWGFVVQQNQPSLLYSTCAAQYCAMIFSPAAQLQQQHCNQVSDCTPLCIFGKSSLKHAHSHCKAKMRTLLI